MTDENGAVEENKIWRGNRSARRKHVAMTLCPLRIKFDLTCH
jgi:hypothetical protein